MCFNPLTMLQPKTPKLTPLPTPPSDNSKAVMFREQLEAEKLKAQGGTAASVKTDLNPSSIVGQKRVLLGV
jgi:hypothetical protein